MFAALSGVCLAGSALSLLSPWFLLFLVPFPLFGYIAMILALTVYRFAPRGGDLQRRIHDLIVAKAELPAASRALDVGCGSGSLVVKLAKASADSTVTGLDSWGRDWEYSKELCEDNARIEGVSARTAFLWQSGAALGFADGSFDADLPRDRRCGAQVRRRGRGIAGPAAGRALRLPRPVPSQAHVKKSQARTAPA